MKSERRQLKALVEARRQEFLVGVGGIDLLAHTFTPRTQERMLGIPLKYAKSQAKTLADICLAEWIEDGHAEGLTPQEFADRRFDTFFNEVDGMALSRFARWFEGRRQKDRPSPPAPH